MTDRTVPLPSDAALFLAHQAHELSDGDEAMTLRPAAAHRAEWRRVLGIFVRALAILALVWFVFQALTGIHAATHAPAEWRAMQ